MPIYNYKCRKCGKIFEKMQSYSEDALRDCPYCGEKESLQKVYGDVAVVYHGHGYYCTDHNHDSGCGCSSCPHKD